MTKFATINAELDRLHEMTRTTIQGDVTYAEVFERIVNLQDQLIKELPNTNHFEIIAREWAKGCSVSRFTSTEDPWECPECTHAFVQAMYRLAQEK